MSISRGNITIYFEDLIKYSLELIGNNCCNVYKESQSEAILPSENEFNNGVEYKFVSGGRSGSRSHSMYVTPVCDSYIKV